VENSSPAEILEERLKSANALKNEGRYEEAMAEFRAILAEAPTHVLARLGLGLVLCFTGEFDASLEELKQAVADGPDCIDARLNLAKTYAMLGMYVEAKGEFQEVLCQSPDHKEACKQLSFINSVEDGASSA
jgi:tetratricopeptide (TPR) repeat protein